MQTHFCLRRTGEIVQGDCSECTLLCVTKTSKEIIHLGVDVYIHIHTYIHIYICIKQTRQQDFPLL